MRNMDLVFSVVEIKALGSGLGRRLSVRLDGAYDGCGQATNCAGDVPPAQYTIHAVLPFSPEFGPLQIGHRFRLTTAPIEIATR